MSVRRKLSLDAGGGTERGERYCFELADAPWGMQDLHFFGDLILGNGFVAL